MGKYVLKRGKFITIEGVEGAGKTSAIGEIRRYLESRGQSTISTREPGGIRISEQIRSVILDKQNTGMDGRTEALLYAAARRQHLVEKILPALKQGMTVICDRFIDSSLAYQGHARDIGLDDVLAVNAFAIGQAMPDLTILLDLDPRIGLERINSDRDREINRMDLETLEFHDKVRAGYQLVHGRFPERIVVVDADRAPEEVLAAIRQVLDCFFRFGKEDGK